MIYLSPLHLIWDAYNLMLPTCVCIYIYIYIYIFCVIFFMKHIHKLGSYWNIFMFV